MKLTPSQVKNYMRRGLRFLVDPEPSADEKRRCIAFFGHACAYCGTQIEPGNGDLDHLVSAAIGGRNHISNRVFSCKPCNAEEKRDKDWESFLREKHHASSDLAGMKQKILDWVETAGALPPISGDILHILDEEGARVTAAYDQASQRLRAEVRATSASARARTDSR